MAAELTERLVGAVVFVGLVAVVAAMLLNAGATDADRDREELHHAVWLRCEGLCPGASKHEPHGDGTATCRSCGTPRHHPGPS